MPLLPLAALLAAHCLGGEAGQGGPGIPGPDASDLPHPPDPDPKAGDGGTPSCDDYIDCTDDLYDPESASCTHTPQDALCPPDPYDCTTAVCDPTYGCQQIPKDSACPPDAIDCTRAVCTTWAGCLQEPDHSLCPAQPCRATYCDSYSGCAEWPYPNGYDCELSPGVPGGCLTGSCIERGCDNQLLDPGEECDPSVQRLGCNDECRSTDWVVSHATPTHDGREDLAPADRAVAVLYKSQKWNGYSNTWGTPDAFVVVWTEDLDADPLYADILARTVDIDTGSSPPPIEITRTARPQQQPVVVATTDGGFLVAWHGYPDPTDPTGDDVDVFLAGFDRDGLPTFHRRVNTTTAEAQLHPSVGIFPWHGTVVVAWEDWSRSGTPPSGPAPLADIRFRAFDINGNPLPGFTTDQLAHPDTAGSQTRPVVATHPYAGGLLAWTHGADPTPHTRLRARLFYPDLTFTGPDFPVDTGTPGSHFQPSAAPVYAGNDLTFLVAWTHQPPTGGSTIRAGLVRYPGFALPAAERAVPAESGGRRHSPAVASNLRSWSTSATILWTSETDAPDADPSQRGLAGTRLAALHDWGTGETTLDRLDLLDTPLTTTTHDAQETPAAEFGTYGALTLVFTDWSGDDGSRGLCEVRARHLPTGWPTPEAAP